MDKEYFDQIVDVFESAGYEPRSYSGRGMNNRYCLGVECSNQQDLLFDFIRGLLDEFEGDSDICGKIRDILEDLENYSVDSMGRDIIVYWPNIKWQKDDEDED